jgi:TRAP-type C4-dicarboxylate transport system permease large subunit
VKRQFSIRDALLTTGVVAIVLGLLSYESFVPFAVACDVAWVALCIGKIAERKLGFRSAFWSTRLTCIEWVVVVVVVIGINLLAFPPKVTFIE